MSPDPHPQPLDLLRKCCAALSANGTPAEKTGATSFPFQRANANPWSALEVEAGVMVHGIRAPRAGGQVKQWLCETRRRSLEDGGTSAGEVTEARTEVQALSSETASSAKRRRILR